MYGSTKSHSISLPRGFIVTATMNHSSSSNKYFGYVLIVVFEYVALVVVFYSAFSLADAASASSSKIHVDLHSTPPPLPNFHLSVMG